MKRELIGYWGEEGDGREGRVGRGKRGNTSEVR